MYFKTVRDHPNRYFAEPTVHMHLTAFKIWDDHLPDCQFRGSEVRGF